MARPAHLGLTSPSFLYALVLTNFVILGITVIIDFVGIWELHHMHDGSPNARLSGIIILLIHEVLTAIQLYFAFMFKSGIQNRDISKCRKWFNATINLIGLELLTIIFYTLLAHNLGYFISYSMIGVMYKFFQLWPVDGFMEEFENISEPLQGESQYHI